MMTVWRPLFLTLATAVSIDLSVGRGGSLLQREGAKEPDVSANHGRGSLENMPVITGVREDSDDDLKNRIVAPETVLGSDNIGAKHKSSAPFDMLAEHTPDDVLTAMPALSKTALDVVSNGPKSVHEVEGTELETAPAEDDTVRDDFVKKHVPVPAPDIHNMVDLNEPGKDNTRVVVDSLEDGTHSSVDSRENGQYVTPDMADSLESVQDAAPGLVDSLTTEEAPQLATSNADLDEQNSGKSETLQDAIGVDQGDDTFPESVEVSNAPLGADAKP